MLPSALGARPPRGGRPRGANLGAGGSDRPAARPLGWMQGAAGLWASPV